jgi:hypothetical protein
MYSHFSFFERGRHAFNISSFDNYFVHQREDNYIYAISVKLYCDMWAVSRKQMGNIATEKFIPGNQLITEHGFHGYENWKV